MYKFLLLSKRKTKPKKQNKKKHTEQEEIKREGKAGPGGSPGRPGCARAETLGAQTARQRPQRDPTHRRQIGKLLFLFIKPSRPPLRGEEGRGTGVEEEFPAPEKRPHPHARRAPRSGARGARGRAPAAAGPSVPGAGLGCRLRSPGGCCRGRPGSPARSAPRGPGTAPPPGSLAPLGPQRLPNWRSAGWLESKAGFKTPH